MKGPTPIYRSFRDAADELGMQRHLVPFLVTSEQIPYLWIKQAKMLDEAAFERLREAYASYMRKADAVA